MIAQVDGPGTCAISVRFGARVGLIDTSSGRAMLAFQTQEQREHMLSEYVRLKGLQPDHSLAPCSAFSWSLSQPSPTSFLQCSDAGLRLRNTSNAGIQGLSLRDKGEGRIKTPARAKLQCPYDVSIPTYMSSRLDSLTETESIIRLVTLRSPSLQCPLSR